MELGESDGVSMVGIGSTFPHSLPLPIKQAENDYVKVELILVHGKCQTYFPVMAAILLNVVGVVLVTKSR